MHKLICLGCSNGCSLEIKRQNSESLIVSGNECLKGVAYSYKQLKTQEPGKFIQDPSRPAFSKEYLHDVFACWGKNLAQILPGVFIQGSPERTMFRTVIKDVEGDKYIIEQVAKSNIAKKEIIEEHLAVFNKMGLAVIPYIAGKNGKRIQEMRNNFWQLVPFIEGIALDRSCFWKEGWRGKAVANFLTDLYRKTESMTFKENVFSIKDYINKITSKIESNRPDICAQLTPVTDLLHRDFFPVHDKIPIGFCHGDPHPFNILWGQNRIVAVIDWEFSGLKPLLYDAALVIGCVGSEDPKALESNFICKFLDTLKKNKLFPQKVFSLIPLFTLATRFAWLSEWLRRDDEEMVEFEISYMHILLNNFV